MEDSTPTQDQTDATSLDSDEYLRYARHFTLPEIGVEGQIKLKAASVLCIGAGGLGSPIALYLAAAGVGTLGIVDPDVVDESNLQRQILHGSEDVGRKKISSAVDSLRSINPKVKVICYDEAFTAANAMKIARDFDIIIDGTDNFPTRYLSNDVAFFLRKPNVYGSIFRFEGQSTVFAPHLGGGCYRCMFPEPPEPGMVPSCAEGGVLGVLPGLVGMIQAIEAIKLITGIGDSLLLRLIHIDALRMKFREFKLRKDPDCPLCGSTPTVTELIDYEAFCGIPSGDSEKDVSSEDHLPTLSVKELSELCQSGSEPVILDVREAFELEICRIAGSIHIPLAELMDRLSELPRERPIHVHCKAGPRSARAVEFLREHDFPEAINVEGGILAWIAEVDQSLTPY